MDDDDDDAPQKGEMLLNLLLESKGAKDVVAIILVHESHGGVGWKL